MGCSESKNGNEETLSRFNHRIQFINQAISSRNTFFAAFSAYAICLKNAGSAFADGIPSEFARPHFPPSPPLIPPPPRPPPLPVFKDYSFMRSASMPEVVKPKPVELLSDYFFPTEEEEFKVDEELKRNSSNRGAVGQQQSKRQELLWDYFFPTEEEEFKADEEPKRNSGNRGAVGQQQRKGQELVFDYFFLTEDVVAVKKVKKKANLPVPVRPTVKKRVIEKGREPASLIQIIWELDHHFFKAFQSTREVFQMLEYHCHQPSGISTFKGHNDFNTKEIQTLATVLNKMLAWEKKLYDEIKTGEVIKYDYQKKVSLLNRQKKQGSTPKSLEKSKASISHLRTRYILEMQSAESTAAEINRICDEQLYPKLVQLVDGMAKMWKTMLFHHESQFKIARSLKSLDNPQPLNASRKHHYDCTIQLCGAVRDWHTQFCGLIEYQKDFVRALHKWLKLSLIPIESNFKEKVSSPLTVQNAPIRALVVAWKNDLDKFPDEAAKNAMNKFAAVIQTIVHQQDDDLKMKETCQATQKELECKNNQFQDCEEWNADNSLKAAKEERESVIISLKQQLEEDEEACTQTIYKAARNRSLASLKHSLPEFFWATSEIALACSNMYHNLQNIAQHQHTSQNS